MRIKGNEWLRVKQVKDKLVSSECWTKMVGEGERTETVGEERDQRAVGNQRV